MKLTTISATISLLMGATPSTLAHQTITLPEVNSPIYSLSLCDTIGYNTGKDKALMIINKSRWSSQGFPVWLPICIYPDSEKKRKINNGNT